MSEQTQAFALYEGTFSVGLDKKFNRIDRDDPPAKGALKISINPFLITSPNRTLLFDVGLGDFGEDTSTELIKENIEFHGRHHADVSDIFISHLHFDHIGGLAGKTAGNWALTFPDATVWVSKNEWNKALAKDSFYDEEKTAFFNFVKDNAVIKLVDENDTPYPEIQMNQIGGHTEFSQVLLYDDGNQKYLMAGDVLATRGEVNRKFAAKYDFDAKKSMKRRKALTQKAFDEHYTVLGYHDSHAPIFNLTAYDENQGYTIQPVNSND